MAYAASSIRSRSVTVRRPTRWICTSEPVQCHRCGMEWENGDPALTLPCTGCCADAGEPCQRRAGGNETVCIKRDRAAEVAGLLRPCERLTWDGRHTKPLRLFGTPLPHMLPVLTGAPVSRVL